MSRTILIMPRAVSIVGRQGDDCLFSLDGEVDVVRGHGRTDSSVADPFDDVTGIELGGCLL